jgi:pyruvate dehydrogenase E1 component beta subunit
MILGRGWGQGPTHSQNLQAWFAHIPGLKVVMPSTAEDAKGLLLSSIFDDDPVIFLEHRWLHNQRGDVADGDIRVPLGAARIVRAGNDITIVAMSYMTIEAIHAVDYLGHNGVSCDLVDLRTIKPIDWATIKKSVRRTGRLLVLDTGSLTGSVSSEIVASITASCWDVLKSPPLRLAAPDFPEATSPALTAAYHIRAEHVASCVSNLLNLYIDIDPLRLRRQSSHDVPGDWFVGPF